MSDQPKDRAWAQPFPVVRLLVMFTLAMVLIKTLIWLDAVLPKSPLEPVAVGHPQGYLLLTSAGVLAMIWSGLSDLAFSLLVLSFATWVGAQ